MRRPINLVQTCAAIESQMSYVIYTRPTLRPPNGAPMKTLRLTLMCLLLAGCTDAPGTVPAGSPDAGAAAPPTQASQAPARRQTMPTSAETDPLPEVDPDPTSPSTPRPAVTPRPTPTPRPSTSTTSTPAPTPTPKPSTTTTPAPTLTPAPTGNQTQPVTLSGSGPSKTASFPLAQGKVKFELTHGGLNNFIVWLVNPAGRRYVLLANEEGNYTGSTTVTIYHPGDFTLEVIAAETWSVSVGPGD